jgi:hypothetical protein
LQPSLLEKQPKEVEFLLAFSSILYLTFEVFFSVRVCVCVCVFACSSGS